MTILWTAILCGAALVAMFAWGRGQDRLHREYWRNVHAANRRYAEQCGDPVAARLVGSDRALDAYLRQRLQEPIR